MTVTDTASAKGPAADTRNEDADYVGRVLRSAWSGSVCAECEEDVGLDESIVLFWFYSKIRTPLGPGLHRVAVGVVCRDCAAEDSHFDHRSLYGWTHGGLSSRRCHCGRQFVTGTRSLRTNCSIMCEREVARRGRQNKRDSKRSSCLGCGESYRPSRADALYCSNACRQRAYRQRQL